MLATTLDNPVTGDRIDILASPLTAAFEPLILCSTLPPGSPGTPPHCHRRLTERFSIELGTLDFLIDGRWQSLRPGTAVTVRPGIVHGFRNDSDRPVTFVCTVAPGAGFERFLRILHGLAKEGRTDGRGMPRDMRAMAAALVQADLLLATVPEWVQRPLLGLLAFAARGLDLARFWRED